MPFRLIPRDEVEEYTVLMGSLSMTLYDKRELVFPFEK